MTSNATFGSTTTASTVAKALSQYIKGKTVLITGVSPTSIGADTAYAIASGHPTKLILASRTKENIDAVAREIRKRNLSVVVQPLILDLSSQRSVRDAAAEVNRSITQLDLLIANAGVMAIPKRTLSEDNIELQFATNHIGHFLFTNLILEKMRVAAKASTVQGAVRLVVLSSNGHRFSPVRFNDYNFEGKPIPEEEEPCIEAMTNRGLDAPVFDSDHYQKFVAYGQSKTANILFALYVRSRLLKEGIQAVSVHPGCMFLSVLFILQHNMDSFPILILGFVK
ncbi:hypothetical protein BGW36DRAFT_388462 [Talaromyces proteolyticus]|uniref:NAD(P)-binding protein n=1 Tax=Talaromyces proteolyticus TaxID=1131652 RepID=A0AAD4KKU4_9EURO|nr:uncharacterized protein BGW36DRAFT_388462 [Talaromyces proteolyticus]KAH8691516.1 hypothetical protein BGW36DRAFT_388462 [Talaromyces proteolyticus]